MILQGSGSILSYMHKILAIVEKISAGQMVLPSQLITRLYHLTFGGGVKLQMLSFVEKTLTCIPQIGCKSQLCICIYTKDGTLLRLCDILCLHTKQLSLKFIYRNIETAFPAAFTRKNPWWLNFLTELIDFYTNTCSFLNF